MNCYSEKSGNFDFLLTKGLRADKFFKLNEDSIGKVFLVGPFWLPDVYLLKDFN